MAPVAEPRHRLLAGIAALVEADRAAVEPRLGGQDAIVDLTTEPRRAGLDAKTLELVVSEDGRVGRLPGIEDLPAGNAVVLVRDGQHAVRSLARAEDEVRAMILERDLAARREAHPLQVVAHRLAELGLGQQQEVVLVATQDPQGRDDARLRRQQQRVAGASCDEGEHVVRHHALQVVA